MICSCATGVRCRKAEQLWKKQAVALTDCQLAPSEAHDKAYSKANLAYIQHVAAASKERLKQEDMP